MLALSRMERSGRVKGEWRATENNRRARYYALTEKGRKALKSETENWGRQIAHQPHPRGIAMGFLRSIQDGIPALRDKSARNDEMMRSSKDSWASPSTRTCAMA
jgi:DNA-binding PadR family transcriptional regulator